MSSELARGFLLLCDKDLESQAATLATTLRTTSGTITLKTMENVLEAKGATFAKKLDNVLNVYAHAVIIICSQNFANFIDKKDKSKCPDVMLKNYKDCVTVLKKFVEKEVKSSPHKLILVSLNGDTTLPKCLTGMPVVKNEGNENAFINQVIAQITAKRR